MPPPEANNDDVTAWLQAWRAGDQDAGEALLQRVYGELKRIAAAQFRAERAGHTLQPTAVVHEAFVRLLGQQRIEWRDRAHFFGLAAAMMRRVLVDHARARATRKRGGDGSAAVLTLARRTRRRPRSSTSIARWRPSPSTYPRQARVVEMRYFADLEIEDIAVCLEVSPATVKRDWQFARAWLRAALRER